MATPTSISQPELEPLVAEVAWRLDHREADRVSDLFTETGSFASTLATLTGRAELEAGFAPWARQSHATRHVHPNRRFVGDGPGDVRGTAILTVHRADRPSGSHPFLVDDCEDRFERDVAGVWRIAERRIIAGFLALARPTAEGR